MLIDCPRGQFGVKNLPATPENARQFLQNIFPRISKPQFSLDAMQCSFIVRHDVTLAGVPTPVFDFASLWITDDRAMLAPDEFKFVAEWTPACGWKLMSQEDWEYIYQR